MTETHNDPIFAVKLSGILRPEDIERYERGFSEQLPGRVIVVDSRVKDIREVTGMRPQNAIVTVRHKRQVPYSMGADGNTPNYREVIETEHVPAKVWPVAMSDGEMLVEWEDGTLGKAKLWDIRIGVRATDTHEIATQNASTAN